MQHRLLTAPPQTLAPLVLIKHCTIFTIEKGINIAHIRKKSSGGRWWHSLLIPALGEAEASGSLSLRQAGLQRVPEQPWLRQKHFVSKQTNKQRLNLNFLYFCQLSHFTGTNTIVLGVLFIKLSNVRLACLLYSDSSIFNLICRRELKRTAIP